MKLYELRGEFEYAAKNYAAVITALTQAVNLSPFNYLAFLFRGLAYHNLGEVQKAIADYSQAIEVGDGNKFQAYINRGEGYFALGDYPAALADFEQGTQLSKNWAGGKAGLAISHYALGETEKAQDLWRELIAVNESYRDTAWVKECLNWRDELVHTAQQIIDTL